MDPISRVVAAGAAGAGGAAAAGLYVDDVFSTFLYEGNQSTLTITNGVDLAGEGGLVWLKSRTNGATNLLIDTERGAKETLKSNETDAEVLDSNSLTTFNSDGFDLGGDTKINYNGADHVSWTFRKAPGFFDVVTYAGNSTARTIPHSLGSVPGMIIVRAYDAANNWYVWHNAISAVNNEFLQLNAINGTQDTGNDEWNSTEPTSTNFSVGTDGNVNLTGRNYIAYVFAHDDQSFGTNSDEAIIKCGSYTGNGSTSGPVVNLGFEPQFIITKNTTGTGNWYIFDVMRGVPVGGNPQTLAAQSSNAEEDASWAHIDITPTGFQIKNTNGNLNTSGSNYIYIAIRRPHKPPEAGTDVFAIDTKSVSSANTPSYSANFPVDLAIRRNNITSTDSNEWCTRITNSLLYSNATSAEVDGGSTFLDYFAFNNGWATATSADSTDYLWMLKRAAGFFDVVAYTGTGSDLTLNHNLGAVPELIICRNRSSGTGRWYVYPGPLSSSEQKHFRLNEDIAVSSSASLDWAPTATTFNADTFLSLSTSGTTYIAYLFATLSGISKVGSYSGTGNNVDVNCGFAAGARFVLIKRTDSTGDWYVWDSTRGIVSGNDPYILLNTTAAQVTTTDYLDPLNAGFTVTSSAPAALNTSGGTYLFLAIA